MVGLAKRGFVLTLDIALGLLVVLAVLAVIFAFSAQSKEDPFPDLLSQKVSSDIVTLLHEQEVLQTFDANKINGNLTLLLPPNYDMQLELQKYVFDSGSSQFALNQSLSAGNAQPADRTIIAGKRLLVNAADQTEYIVVEYFAWLK